MARQSGGVLATSSVSATPTRRAKSTPKRRSKPGGERVLLEPLPMMLPATQTEPKPEQAARIQPSDHAIRERAYQIYLERGCQPGHAVEDWMQAERELLQRAA